MSESVEADIRTGFDKILSVGDFKRELDGCTLDEDAVFATAEHLVVAPWVYRCTHIGDFLGVPPTYVDLELRGTTFVHVPSPDPEELVVFPVHRLRRRASPARVSTTSRPALTVDEFENWAKNNQDVHPRPVEG